jgi:hypothetical protein
MLYDYESALPLRSTRERAATRDLCKYWNDDMEVSSSRNNNTCPWLTSQVALNKVYSKCAKETKTMPAIEKNLPSQKANMADVSTQVTGAVLVPIKNVESKEMIPLIHRKTVIKHLSSLKLMHCEKENGYVKCMKLRKFPCNTSTPKVMSSSCLPTMRLVSQYKLGIASGMRSNRPIIISRKILYKGLHSMDRCICAKSIL